MNISRVELRCTIIIKRIILITRNTIKKNNLSPRIGKNARKLDIKNGITRNIMAIKIVRRYNSIIVK